VHVQLAIVANEARVAELLHEETEAGARGADHVGQLVRTDLGMTISCLPSFPRLTATDHMILLNRPGNDSAGLQQQAAVFQNRRSG
jgi:hypothetical protein